ncbi:helix-turn-helix domain-containing protein [Dactylosporangium sp. NPDC048998]|uniref:helix-turn-helix domain-containing protein n=1 Tax=Dactylosporangium sp. NPDC048998 TaxID=3363976 RepID=UPI0037181193
MTEPEDLAQRLRDLRTTADVHGLSPMKVSQGDLAHAFGVSVPLISSWEKPVGAARPGPTHLEKYARLFATPRSFAGQRPELLDLEALTPEERVSYDELKKKLGLESEPANPLRFPLGEPLTVVCAELPEQLQAAREYADPLSPDHVELYSYADPDALFDLYSYLRQVNPNNRIRYKLVTRLDRADLDTHLLLLGGVDWNTLTRQVYDVLGLPVAQVGRDGIEAGAFEVTDPDGASRTLVPVLEKVDGRLRLLEDVAHLCRAPNPFSRQAMTVTIFNAMYGRGTYGIVRALTDVDWRERNFRYLEWRFGSVPTFSLVSRVRIVAGIVTVPNWTDPRIRLHEWPMRSG